MDYLCRLGSLGNSSTTTGSSYPEGTIGLSYIVRPSGLLFFLLTLLLSIFIIFFLPTSSVSLSYFIHSVPMCKCSGKHSCMSSTFYISILNGTICFRSAKTAVCSDNGVLN